MIPRSQHLLHQFQLVTEYSLKGATNYGNRATGVGTKHAVLRPRPKPGPSGLETKAETLAVRSPDQDRDLGLQVSRPKPRSGQNELECTRVSRPWSRDHNTVSGPANSAPPTLLLLAHKINLINSPHLSAFCLTLDLFSSVRMFYGRSLKFDLY